MTWSDAVRMATRGLRRHTARSILTVMAVALAAALLSALLAIASTARNRVLSQVAHGGTLAAIAVEPAGPSPAGEGLDNPTPGPDRDLTPSALDAIRSVPHVTSVVPVMATQVRVVPAARLCPPGQPSCGPPEFDAALIGLNLADTTTLPVSLTAGRYPARGSTDQVDVTQDYLQRVGVPASRASSVVGTTVELGAFRILGDAASGGPGALGVRWVGARVVGVVDQQATPGAVVAWPPLAQADFSWTAGGQAAGDFNVPSSPYAGAIVSADRLGDVSAVRQAIAGIGYNTSAPQNIVVSVDRYLRVVELVLSAIGLVALTIAALGIANALLAAVWERRRDIGVMKALGARDRDVLRAFLVEAGAVGVGGGAIGAAAGAGVATIIGAIANHELAAQGLHGVAVSVPPAIIALAVGGSVLLSLVAGTIPARRAARMSPREAVDT